MVQAVDGTLVEVAHRPSECCRKRPTNAVTRYVVADADGSRSVFVTTSGMGTLALDLPHGARLRKARWDLDYRLNGARRRAGSAAPLRYPAYLGLVLWPLAAFNLSRRPHGPRIKIVVLMLVVTGVMVVMVVMGAPWFPA